MEIIKKYATSFYGSPLWNLSDGSCDRLFTAWNNAIRDTFAVDRKTHKYLLEEISNSDHPLLMLSLRFVKFHQTLQKSKKRCVKFLSSLSKENLQTS